MRYGLVAGGPLKSLGALATEIEDRGFHTVWTAETGSDAYLQAALAAQATSRVRIGTSIALAFVRSPGITAMAAADLDELSGGRFVLGLGSQVKRVNEMRFSTPFEHPAPKMREYALAVRAFFGGWAGEKPTHEGRFYNVTMSPWPRNLPPVRPQVPIFFAAVNKVMLKAAGEVADGVIGHPMTSPRYIADVVLPRIALGAETAGRKPDEIELAQQIIVSIASSEAERPAVLREVKQQIGFYATTRTYTPVLQIHGFEGIVPDLREAFASGDMERLASIVPDDAADTFAICGTLDEVRQKLARFDGLVGELIIGFPWYRVDPGRTADNYRAILDASLQ